MSDLVRWEWNETKELAAHLVAQGRLRIPKIALKCQVSEKTIDRWKKSPEFLKRVEEHLAAIRIRFRSEGFAVRENRIANKRRRLCGLMRVLKKRAGNALRGGAEWDDTGFVVRREKSLNRGDGIFDEVIEYEIDTGTLAALNDLEREIAIETGDYKTKIEHSGKIDVPSNVAVVISQSLTTTEILTIIERHKNVEPSTSGPEPLPPAADQPEGPTPGPETEGGE